MNKVEFVEVNHDESNKALKVIETDKTITNVNKVRRRMMRQIKLWKSYLFNLSIIVKYVLNISNMKVR